MSRFAFRLSVGGGLALAFAGSQFFCASSLAGDFAGSVVSYTPGNLGQDAAWNDPQAALGPMTDNAQFGSLNPFNPPFNAPNPPGDPGQIVIIHSGGTPQASTAGSLTVKLQTPISTAGGYLGVFVNNGLEDVSADGSGLADGNADTFSDYPQSLVSVSDSLTDTPVSLGMGPVTFNNPSNYWANAPAYSNYTPTAGTILANQSQPFFGGPTDFANRTWPYIRDNVLDGSAGGNWLSLSGVGFSEIQYVTFTVPAGADYRMVVDSISAVPEPGTGIVAAGGVGLLLARRRRIV